MELTSSVGKDDMSLLAEINLVFFYDFVCLVRLISLIGIDEISSSTEIIWWVMTGQHPLSDQFKLVNNGTFLLAKLFSFSGEVVPFQW